LGYLKKEDFIMTFELLCMGLIGLLFGLAVTFGGYRLFLILLPIWGFFFGFFLGAETVQVIFGIGFLATVTSWVAGFIVGAVFAILSYLFYIFAVAILSFSAGYGLTVGILDAIGLNLGFLVWIIAVIIGVVVAVAVIAFNIQKYAIIVITALGGTAAIIYTLLGLFGGFALVELLLGPVRLAVRNSFWWLLFFLVVAGAGIVFQIRANRSFEIDTYNRLADA
jgi:hypothetical protein